MPIEREIGILDMVSRVANTLIYYAALESEAELQVLIADVMPKLSSVLRELLAPLRLRIEPLPGHLHEAVACALREKSADVAVGAWISDVIWKRTGEPPYVPQMLLALNASHPYALHCVDCDKNALWGAARRPLAVVYGNLHRAVFWHETLHLL